MDDASRICTSSFPAIATLSHVLHRLGHREETKKFYGKVKKENFAVRVGMEDSGHRRRFCF
jgi:hypothetical protein